MLFWVASGLVGFNFADNIVKAMVTATAQTSIRLVENATLAANRVPSLTLLGLPIGMLSALILTEMFYDVKDTYFTNEVEAMSLCCDKSIILIAITLVTDFWGLIFGNSPWTSLTEQSPIASRSSMKDWCAQAFRLRTFVISFELTLTLVALFFALLQPEYLTNSFRFTSQDAKILLTYYVIGIAFGCIMCPSLIESLGTTVKVQWFACFALATSSAVMLSFISADDVNIVLTCICIMIMSASIMVSLLANLRHIGEELTSKTMSEKSAFLACTIGLAGLGAAILTFLGDYLYYLNRNTLVWAYLESSAFPIGFLLVNAVLHHLTAGVFPSSTAATSINLNLHQSGSADSPATNLLKSQNNSRSSK